MIGVDVVLGLFPMLKLFKRNFKKFSRFGLCGLKLSIRKTISEKQHLKTKTVFCVENGWDVRQTKATNPLSKRQTKFSTISKASLGC